jgi:hypothetical protein
VKPLAEACVKYLPIPQPAKAYIALRPDLTVRAISKSLGVSEPFLGRCLNGRIPTPQWIASAVADLLGVELEEAFRPELEVLEREGAA